MPNIDPSIPLSGKDPFSSLSGMVGTMQGIQNLQTGAIEQQRRQVQLTQEQGALDARRAVAGVINDPEIKNPDTGLVDVDKFLQRALQVDPNNYVATEAGGKIAVTNSQMLKMKSDALSLGNEAQAYVSQRLGALALEPDLNDTRVHQALDEIGQMMPAAKQWAENARKFIQPLHEKDQLAAGLTKIRNFGFGMQAQQPQTTFVQSGRQAVPAQSNPLAGAVGPMAGATPIETGLVPATQAEVEKKDVLGNSYLEVRPPNGQVYNKAMPGASIPPLLAFPPGETAVTAQGLSTARTASNQRALGIPEQHFNNQQIIALADRGSAAITGSAADKLNAALGSVGIQKIGPADDAATAYQRLGHFLSLQSQENAKAMGAGTDAARNISEQATASRTWTKEAIKSATKVNDALATGVDYFNRGLEASINNPQNQKSIFAARDFQNAWAKNFDVDAMRLLNAAKSGDKAEQAAIIKELGGADSARAKALAQKIRVLDALATTGRP